MVAHPKKHHISHISLNVYASLRTEINLNLNLNLSATYDEWPYKPSTIACFCVNLSKSLWIKASLELATHTRPTYQMTMNDPL